MKKSKPINVKNGLISQRVPLKTQEQLERLSNKARLPKSVYLQLIVEADYKKTFKTKS